MHILANETNQAMGGTGIHVHVNRTINGRMERFGHKADIATLFDFTVGAYLDEMGITSALESEKN